MKRLRASSTFLSLLVLAIILQPAANSIDDNPPGNVADLSLASEYVGLSPLLEPFKFHFSKPGQAVHHEIAIPEGCPELPITPNGDGDGDGAADDRQLDLNGAAPGLAQQAANGTVELWCINPSYDPGPPEVYGGYYALQYDPAGPAGPRWVGKCPFEGGRNEGWKFIDALTGDIERMEWESVDRGLKDDDGDGALDEWDYFYDVAGDTVEQEHSEDGAVQGDGAGPAAPPTRPFDFDDLLPEDPTDDDPTPGGLAAAWSQWQGVFVPVGPMAADLPVIPTGLTVTLTVNTHLANEGPSLSEAADATLTVAAPAGCTVDGAASASRSHLAVPVDVGAVGLVTDTLALSCAAPGVYVFTLTSSITPTDPGTVDPEASDDESVMTLTVRARGSLYLPAVYNQ